MSNNLTTEQRRKHKSRLQHLIFSTFGIDVEPNFMANGNLTIRMDRQHRPYIDAIVEMLFNFWGVDEIVNTKRGHCIFFKFKEKN